MYFNLFGSFFLYLDISEHWELQEIVVNFTLFATIYDRYFVFNMHTSYWILPSKQDNHLLLYHTCMFTVIFKFAIAKMIFSQN